MTFNPERCDTLSATRELAGWLKETLQGRGRLVFLTGREAARRQAAEELGASAEAARMYLGSSRCRPTDHAYQAWITSVQSLLLDERLAGDARARELGRSSLYQLRGALARGARHERDQEEFWAFDTVALFLGYIVVRRPVLQLFDDIQHADLASLRLLHFVARSLHTAPLLIVASHGAELASDDPISSYLKGELARESKRVIV